MEDGNAADPIAGQHETAAASALASLGVGEQQHNEDDYAGQLGGANGEIPSSFQRKVRRLFRILYIFAIRGELLSFNSSRML